MDLWWKDNGFSQKLTRIESRFLKTPRSFGQEIEMKVEVAKVYLVALD